MSNYSLHIFISLGGGKTAELFIVLYFCGICHILRERSSLCVSTDVGRVGCVAEKHPHLSETGIHRLQHHRHLQKPDS